MIIYHEIDIAALPAVKSQGLKRTSQGAKSDDTTIIRTNNLLDKHCPPQLKAAGLSRRNNIYGYLGDTTSIIDIQTGKSMSLQDKKRQSELVVLRIEVNPQYCWVSDLDRYDRVKKAVVSDASSGTLSALCNDYWASVQPLLAYSAQIERPEIMITHDIEASAIQEV